MNYELYRVTLVVSDLGWVDFDFYVPSSCLAALPVLPNSQLPKQNWASMGYQNSSQPNPGPRPPVSPCTTYGQSMTRRGRAPTTFQTFFPRQKLSIMEENFKFKAMRRKDTPTSNLLIFNSEIYD